MRGLLVVVTSIFFLAGCAAPGPTIIANANPATDFSRLNTYAFMQPLSSDRDNGVRTPVSTRLITAMTLELERRGFHQSESPDLLVDFFVVTEDRTDVRTTPTMTTTTSMRRHSHSRHSFSVSSAQQTTIRRYTVGTLGIDLVDVASNSLAWEGAAEARVQDDVSNMSQGAIDELTRLIMEQFPHVAN